MSGWRIPRLTRRQFIGLAAGASAITAAGVIYRGSRAPLPLGLIGCGDRGQQLARTVSNNSWLPEWAEIRAICDVDSQHIQAVRQRACPSSQSYSNYLELLDRPDLAGVLIASPDHWHVPMTLEAVKRGKAVYCEKPVSLTIGEGSSVVRQVHDRGAVVQVGTQQRSHWQFQRACELVRNGRLGQLLRVRIDLPENLSGGPFTTSAPPPNLNWEQWLGPAPWAEFCKERCHSTFRGWYEYSGGKITDWGAHHLDIVHWAMGDNTLGPTRLVAQGKLPQIPNGYNVPPQFQVELEYPGPVIVELRSDPVKNGILFQGDLGEIYVNRKRLGGKPVEELSRNPLPLDAWRVSPESAYATSVLSYETRHLLNFFNAIRHGTPVRSDIAQAHRSASACHLANIALRSQRALHWSPASESFSEDKMELTSYLDRPARS